MNNNELEVSTPHNNVVEVSQEDLNNPMPSTAEASPQSWLVQSSAIWGQSSANAMIWEKETLIWIELIHRENKKKYRVTSVHYGIPQDWKLYVSITMDEVIQNETIKVGNDEFDLWNSSPGSYWDLTRIAIFGY